MLRSNRTNQKQPLCWNREPQSPALRVEQSDGGLFIFPYSHWVYAQLVQAAGKDCLLISYSSHEVKITGQHLNELAIALQHFSVDWIKSIPARYSVAPKNDAVLIERIEITESSDEKPPQGEGDQSTSP